MASQPGLTRLPAGGAAYMRFLNNIYGLKAPEEMVKDDLPGYEQEDFRLFCIGYKLAHGYHDYDPPTYMLTCAEWKRLKKSPARREAYIKRAEDNSDPRLAEINFKFTSLEQEVYAKLPAAEKQRFQFYMIGCRVSHPDWSLAKMLKQWKTIEPHQKERRADFGREWREKFRAGRLKRGVSLNEDYYYRPKDRYPDPTFHDRKYAIAELEKLENRMGNWVFEKTIFQNPNDDGSHTRRIIHIFARVDEEGNLVERLVVKIQGAKSEDIKVRMEREFGIHTVLSKVRSPHILECYGWSIRRRKEDPQLGYAYLEYAPFGDLMSIIENVCHPDAQVPEPFIWMVVQAIASAIYTLHTGKRVPPHQPSDHSSTDPSNDKLEKSKHGWNRIINVDIKLDNVVLGHADKDTYPAFKVPKMIDFGSSYYEEAIAKGEGKGLGTPGWRPPEQIPKGPFGKEPLTLATEIFNIGLIMLSLMEWKEVTFQPPHTTAPTFSQAYDGFYSFQLADLALRCVRLNPKDRPQLLTLLWESTKGLERWMRMNGELRGKELKDIPELLRMEFEAEEVRVGDKVPKEWGVDVKKRKAEESDEDVRPVKRGRSRNVVHPLRGDDKPAAREAEGFGDKPVVPNTKRKTRKPGGKVKNDNEEEDADDDEDDEPLIERLRMRKPIAESSPPKKKAAKSRTKVEAKKRGNRL